MLFSLSLVLCFFFAFSFHGMKRSHLIRKADLSSIWQKKCYKWKCVAFNNRENNRALYNEKWLRVNKQWNSNAIKDILATEMQTRQHSVSILWRKIQPQLKSIWIGRKLNFFHRILKNYFTWNPFVRFFLAKKKECQMDKNVWSHFHLISVVFFWSGMFNVKK